MKLICFWWEMKIWYIQTLMLQMEKEIPEKVRKGLPSLYATVSFLILPLSRAKVFKF